jgi:hypothetical protein
MQRPYKEEEETDQAGLQLKSRPGLVSLGPIKTPRVQVIETIAVEQVAGQETGIFYSTGAGSWP